MSFTLRVYSLRFWTHLLRRLHYRHPWNHCQRAEMHFHYFHGVFLKWVQLSAWLPWLWSHCLVYIKIWNKLCSKVYRHNGPVLQILPRHDYKLTWHFFFSCLALEYLNLVVWGHEVVAQVKVMQGGTDPCNIAIE